MKNVTEILAAQSTALIRRNKRDAIEERARKAAQLPQQTFAEASIRSPYRTRRVLLSPITRNLIADDNPRRYYLMIVNPDPANRVWISFGDQLAVNQGIPLGANGGFYEAILHVPSNAVYGNSETQNVYVTVVEG